MEYITLNNGIQMPILGYGVYQVSNEECERCVLDAISVGYPIWWGEAPHIVYTLVENVSLKGKTVVPFSTSISSGLGSSARHLKAKAKISSRTKWLKGRNFYDIPSQKSVDKWIKKLKY